MQHYQKGVGDANGEVFSQLHSQSTRCLEGDGLTHPPPSILPSFSLSIHPLPSLCLSILLPPSLISHSFWHSDSNNYSETLILFPEDRMFRKLHPKLAVFQREDLFLEYSSPPGTRDLALGLRM